MWSVEESSGATTAAMPPCAQSLAELDNDSLVSSPTRRCSGKQSAADQMDEVALSWTHANNRGDQEREDEEQMSEHILIQLGRENKVPTPQFNLRDDCQGWPVARFAG
jgi:hypothetical protein